MIYSFTLRDVDDLDENDEITYERKNGTIAKIKITKVIDKGNNFKTILKYKVNPNDVYLDVVKDIDRASLLTLITDGQIRDFKKAKTLPNNQVSKPSSMQEIRVETILNLLPLTKRRKNLILDDFKSSGNLMFGDLVAYTPFDTRLNLENKIDGFSSGVHTPAISKAIVDMLFDYSDENGIPNIPISTNKSSMPSSMQDIRVDEIIGMLGWSSGLKISMIADFDKSGYQTFRDLVKDTIANTSREIQSKIQGFSSGKNTYLQAGIIAEELFKYAQSNGISNIPPTKKFSGWDEFTLPKSGIVVYKSNSGVSEKILLDPTYLDDKGGILQDELTKYLLYSSIIEEYEESQESFLWNFNGSMSPKSLHEFYDDLDDILVKYIINTPSQTIISSQPNLEEPIYGIIIKGTYSGELVRVVKPINNGYEEKDFDYECILNGQNSFLPRNNFMVVGDIIEITFTNTGRVLERKIVVIQNDTTIKIVKKGLAEENWNIGGFSWDEDNVQILEYYNLHEIFESKNPILNQPPLPPTIINQYEAELNQAKKDVAQLMFLRSVVSPIDFEQKIQIGQLLSEKQKGVNELNFKIVEKKLSSGNIFDDLFEQSFTQIKNVYDDVYVSPNEPVDFFAPNGDRSKLSDALNQIIRTPQFMEWFGNWELAYLYKDTDDFDYKCSQVVSESGEPLLVWHGTGQAFSYFKFDTFPAAYFAVNRDYSQWFAELHGGGDGYTIPFFLNVRNPLDLTYFHLKKVSSNDFFAFLYLKTGMDMDELEVNPIFKDPNFPPNETWVYLRNNPKMLKKIADMNLYDGIHFYETNPGVAPSESAHSTEVYITFTPHQAKIADPNRGLMLLSSLKSFLLEKGGKI